MTSPNRLESKSDRRAMADAIRHMRDAGLRFTDIHCGCGATPWQVEKSLNRIIVLPRRDGIGLPGVASPRQIHSSLAEEDDLLPLAGRNGTTPDPVAPASFSGAEHRVNGVEQSGAGDVVGSMGHDDVVSHRMHAVIGNARGVLPCAR